MFIEVTFWFAVSIPVIMVGGYRQLGRYSNKFRDSGGDLREERAYDFGSRVDWGDGYIYITTIDIHYYTQQVALIHTFTYRGISYKSKSCSV